MKIVFSVLAKIIGAFLVIEGEFITNVTYSQRCLLCSFIIIIISTEIPFSNWFIIQCDMDITVSPYDLIQLPYDLIKVS